MPNNLLQQTHYIIFLNNKINIIITANTTKNFLKSNLKKYNNKHFTVHTM